MKKILYYFLASIILLAPFSCKDDDPAPAPLVSAPEALAAEDGKSGGVYKGALIGSSGVIKVVLQGGVKEIQITLDGVKKTLTTTDLGDWESGDEIIEAEFSNGDWIAFLSITSNGSDISISFNVAGHPGLTGVIGKETSTTLLKAFEGKYTGSSNGTWNFVVLGQSFAGLSVDDDGQLNGFFYGSVINNVITITSGDVDAAGTLTPGNPDMVSGTWAGDSQSSGTWTGKRTL